MSNTLAQLPTAFFTMQEQLVVKGAMQRMASEEKTDKG